MITPYWLIDILLYAVMIYLLICLFAFLLQSKFIFFPTIEKQDFKYKLASIAEEFSIETPNKGKVNGLLIKVEEPKGLIFYLHGNTGSIKRWRFMAEELSTYGYDVYIPDYRGYGKSTGRRSEIWMHQDMQFCYDKMVSNYEKGNKVIYGRSLGSGFAVRLAARSAPDALILETPFYSLLDVAMSYFPLIPMKWLLRYRFRSDIYIMQVECPTIIFHGTKDRIVPYSSALKLFNSVKEKVNFEMVTLQGARHNNLNRYPLFREKLLAFFDEIKKANH